MLDNLRLAQELSDPINLVSALSLGEPEKIATISLLLIKLIDFPDASVHIFSAIAVNGRQLVAAQT